MKAIKALLIPALAALGLAAVAEAHAQANALQSGSQSRAGSRIGTAVQGGGTDRHFGRHDGNRHDGPRHWRGHHHHRWHGHFGFFFGAPLLWSAWHWGWPYYDPFFHPYPRALVYREVERWPEMSPPESTQLPKGEGAPTQGPLYMNYCESAKAYFPKVTSCPEGWKMTTPSN